MNLLKEYNITFTDGARWHSLRLCMCKYVFVIYGKYPTENAIMDIY